MPTTPTTEGATATVLPSATAVESTRAGGSTLQSLLVLGAAAAAAVVSLSGAVLTDSEDLGTTTVTSGSVDIVPSVASLDFGLTTAAPGDLGTVRGVTLTNAGSLELRYSITSVTSEDVLAAELLLDVWREADEATVDGTCAESSVHAGPRLHQGVYGSTAGTALVGNPAQGADTGDRVLAPSGSELLCFDLALPLAATVQGGTTSATFTVDGEQTKNN